MTQSLSTKSKGSVAPRRSASSVAEKAIGPITRGCRKFVLTGGQFSFIDGIEFVAREIGPCHFACATWTAHASDLTRVEEKIKKQSFLSARFLLDPSFKSRKPAFFNLLIEKFGDCVRTMPTHAKFSILGNDEFKICITTSMNLNQNARIELFCLDEDEEIYNFFLSFVDEQFCGGMNLSQSPEETNRISMGNVPVSSRLF